MPSPTNPKTSLNTKNPYEVPPPEDPRSKETGDNIQSTLAENAVPAEKLDELTSVRFKNQILNPQQNNKSGELAVVLSNLKFCLRGRTPAANPVWVPVLQKPFNFFQSNVTINQAAVALAVLGLAGNTEYVMPFGGSVIGISVASNDARTAGTLTVDATINGTVTGLQAVLNATNTTYHYGVQDAQSDVFVAGQRIGCKITTDGSWAPTTGDIVVTVIVQ